MSIRHTVDFIFEFQNSFIRSDNAALKNHFFFKISEILRQEFYITENKKNNNKITLYSIQGTVRFLSNFSIFNFLKQFFAMSIVIELICLYPNNYLSESLTMTGSLQDKSLKVSTELCLN